MVEQEKSFKSSQDSQLTNENADARLREITLPQVHSKLVALSMFFWPVVRALSTTPSGFLESWNWIPAPQNGLSLSTEHRGIQENQFAGESFYPTLKRISRPHHHQCIILSTAFELCIFFFFFSPTHQLYTCGFLSHFTLSLLMLPRIPSQINYLYSMVFWLGGLHIELP